MKAYCPEEFFSRSQLRSVQKTRLIATVERAAKSEFYARRFAETGVDLRSITSADDITRLPFTTKDDLRSAYPSRMLTRPVTDMVRLHASSGTTGAATVIYYTRNDIDSWADLMARCMHMVGVRAEDTFQNMSGYGLFTGGLGIHYGAERLGCLTIPAGAGNSKRQLKLLEDFQVAVIHIIPSYALHLGTVKDELGYTPDRLKLRIALIGAEPHTVAIRERIEEVYSIKAYNSYGLSEMNGPGVAFECLEQNGMHLWEDAYLPEIVHPETGAPVADGEIGELVITTITKEAQPLIRYRTRDITRIEAIPCRCGRTHRRISRIQGRSDDMLIIRGVNVFPQQIETILLETQGVAPHYQLILTRQGSLDMLEVKVEVDEKLFSDEIRHLQRIEAKIQKNIKEFLGVTAKVTLSEPQSIERSEGKAKRIIDLRNS